MTKLSRDSDNLPTVDVSRGTMRMFRVEQCIDSAKLKTRGNPDGSSRCVLRLKLPCAYQQEPPQGTRHRNGLAPLPGLDFLNLWQIPGSDPEDNLFRCNLFRMRPLQKGREIPQSTGANEIERRNLFSQLLIAADEDPSACKSKITNDFRKKCRLLDI